MTSATLLNFTPARHGAGNAVAWFDVELGNGIRLFRLKLAQTRNGYRVYAPKDAVGHTVSLPIALADQLVELAQHSLKAVADVKLTKY